MRNSKKNIPNHVAIIPDGNRRWARAKGLEPWEGHEEGAKNIEKLIDTASAAGVKVFSIWGSSMDNLIKRPLKEKQALLGIYKKYFRKMLDGPEIHKNEAKVNIIGHWEDQFPEALKEILYELIERTKNYKKRVLNFMLAYGGTDDVLNAVSKISEKYKTGMKITAEMFKENLMTAGISPVDFLIRTGGEPHNSNGFLMWDTADSQLYFFEGNFPDFGPEEFKKALGEYGERGRRYGR